jgi:hypothetical protein
LREGEPVDRVVGGSVPVDELLGDVGVGPEREDRRDGTRVEPVIGVQAGAREKGVQVACRDRPEAVDDASPVVRAAW